MSKFYLINERRFPLQVENHTNTDLLSYYRWEHRVTIGYSGRRFMLFLDNLKSSVYIEETTMGLKEIEDDELWDSLFHWATEKGFLMVIPPLVKPKIQRFV